MTGIPLRLIAAPEDRPGVMQSEWSEFQPGDVWRDPDGLGWAVVLPNRTVWYSGLAAEDGSHWAVSGEAPNLTVTPSIDDRDPARPWHGWVRDGQLVQA